MGENLIGCGSYLPLAQRGGETLLFARSDAAEVLVVDEPRVLRIVVDPFGSERPARLNSAGTRAVFFKDDGTLRIVALETGHGRDIANPGIDWSTATWTPDGLWILDPVGLRVIALNTLDGRSVAFPGVPGDVSPGWLAIVDRAD